MWILKDYCSIIEDFLFEIVLQSLTTITAEMVEFILPLTIVPQSAEKTCSFHKGLHTFLCLLSSRFTGFVHLYTVHQGFQIHTCKLLFQNVDMLMQERSAFPEVSCSPTSGLDILQAVIRN